MKKLLLAIALLTSCQAAPVVLARQPVVPVGFTFSAPCEVHGVDVWTILDVGDVYSYTIGNSDGSQISVDEAALLAAFEEFGIELDTK